MDYHCLILKDSYHYKTKPKINSKELKYTQTGIKYLKIHICETVKTQKEYGNKVSQSISLRYQQVLAAKIPSDSKQTEHAPSYSLTHRGNCSCHPSCPLLCIVH